MNVYTIALVVYKEYVESGVTSDISFKEYCQLKQLEEKSIDIIVKRDQPAGA